MLAVDTLDQAALYESFEGVVDRGVALESMHFAKPCGEQVFTCAVSGHHFHDLAAVRRE